MNERIRELAEQAELYAVRDNSSMLLENWKKHYTEKLAELIIRECAQFVEDKFDFIGDEIIVKEKMLEHFGVKQ